MADVIYTVGHSTQPQEQFLALLAEFGIQLLADIRSFPVSRRHPWFAQEALQAERRLQRREERAAPGPSAESRR